MVGAWLAALFVCTSALVGVAVDWGWGTVIDAWVHDPALVYRARTEWRHVALVVLDEGVPVQVGRKQVLPLFARAAERLVRAGAKGIFLDARLSKEMEVAMPYALCLEDSGAVRWSPPRCLADAGRCRLTGSEAGLAPLAMAGEVFAKFRVAPYLAGQEQLPDFLLYGLEALPFMPRSALTASDRLVSLDPAVMRWMDLSPDHAVVQLAAFVDPERTRHALARSGGDEDCGGIRCRRIRLGRPVYRTQPQGKRPIVPLSLLATCDEGRAFAAAAGFKGRAVILQLTAPAEATDMLVTPMTVAWGGPHLLTPGAQFLADAVETLLLGDHPRAPPWSMKVMLFIAVAAVSVWLGWHQRQVVHLGGFLVLAVVMVGLCFGCRLRQLWPVSATLAAYLSGLLQTIGLHLVIGLREGRLIRRYMPRQIHDLLIAPGELRFRNRCHQAIVLMSDLKSYTTLTQVLKDPAGILELMNDYLEETSLILQEKYQGWLEAYVGDLVCYYWPLWQENSVVWRNALLGAVELRRLQQRFFAGLKDRYAERFPQPTLQCIAALIDAGIGMAAGVVVMGELGPRRGVRKFGILGDPLNLAARLESLTRVFDCHLIVSEELARRAGEVGLAQRRLGRIAVKGRPVPVAVFALGEGQEEGFSAENVTGWENWLATIERGGEPTSACPAIYAKDQRTLIQWQTRGLLKAGVFYLDEK